MKNSIVILILAALTVSISSCSYYSCATYAKGNPKQSSQKVKI
jgi:hypothetical protein